jgi:hypothetical protein
LTISRRNSALERQVPMIEQWTLGCMSQIAVRRVAAGGTNSAAGASPGRRAFIGISPRTNAGAAGGRPVEKMLDNISGARDDMTIYPIRYNACGIAEWP